MASIRKRNGQYQVQIRNVNTSAVATFKTIKEACQWVLKKECAEVEPKGARHKTAHETSGASAEFVTYSAEVFATSKGHLGPNPDYLQ